MLKVDATAILHVGEQDVIGFTLEGLADGVTISSVAVSVLKSPGLTLGSGTGLITADEDGAYVWVEAVAIGEYDVKFSFTLSDSRKPIKIYLVKVIQP